MGLQALIAIGGDGTFHISDGFIKKGLSIVGVPKTIDNDLSETDFTFGFDSAVWVATEAIDRLHTTAQAHHRVMVVEVMGRYAGWIALHSESPVVVMLFSFQRLIIILKMYVLLYVNELLLGKSLA